MKHGKKRKYVYDIIINYVWGQTIDGGQFKTTTLAKDYIHENNDTKYISSAFIYKHKYGWPPPLRCRIKSPISIINNYRRMKGKR